MPQRVTSSSASIRRPSIPSAQHKVVTAQTAWKPGAKKPRAEVPLDRWHRLRSPVLEGVKVKSTVISDEARRMAKGGLAPRQAQDMLDELNGLGMAEPMWPHFKSMGFKDTDASDLRMALKRFDNGRRTSLGESIGTAGLAKRAPNVEKLSAVVEALTKGTSVELPELLKRAPADERLARATALLENELSHFLTDNPADLVDSAPAAVKRGLEAVINSETAQLARADDAGFRKMKHDGFSSPALLRELTVLDPTAARTAGTKFADALNAH